MINCAKVILFLIVNTIFIFFSCNNENKEKSPVPYRTFTISVNLSLPEFSSLGYGDKIYLTGGSSGLGIIVYRHFPNKFVAFDRMCTSTTHDPAAIKRSDKNEFHLVCPQCSSIFLIIDGSIVSGVAKYYLMEFNTTYFESKQELIISN